MVENSRFCGDFNIYCFNLNKKIVDRSVLKSMSNKIAHRGPDGQGFFLKDNIGLATSPMDFSLPAYSGSNGPCVKFTWANTNKVSWDGITYGVPNPCITK